MFLGIAHVNDWIEGTCSLTFVQKKIDYTSTWSALIIIGNTHFRIEPAGRYEMFRNDENIELKDNNGRHLFIAARMGEDLDLTRPKDLDIRNEDGEIVTKRRKLNLERFNNCWPDQSSGLLKRITIGYEFLNCFIFTILTYF